MDKLDTSPIEIVVSPHVYDVTIPSLQGHKVSEVGPDWNCKHADSGVPRECQWAFRTWINQQMYSQSTKTIKFVRGEESN
jgi:hypothetical protein